MYYIKLTTTTHIATGKIYVDYYGKIIKGIRSHSSDISEVTGYTLINRCRKAMYLVFLEESDHKGFTVKAEMVEK